MNRQQSRKNEKIGNRLIKRNPEVALLARQSAINDMCKGEYDTDFYRALANVKMDLMEGKITQERFDELVQGITKPIPLSERDPVKATSMKKLYSKIKWDKLTGKE